MISKGALAVNAAAFALLTWLYGGDVLDWVRAQSAEVSAMSQLPTLPFALVLLLLALVGGGLTAAGVLQKRDGAWKGYRVMPIVAVVGLFVDLLVVSANKTPFSSPARAGSALELFEHRANELSTPGSVPTDRQALEAVVSDLGEPPWLVKGVPVQRWSLQLLEGCQGPRVDRGEASAGTLFYCVSADRSQAWVTAVGLPREERFGVPQVVSSGGQPLVGVVRARGEEPAEAPIDEPGDGEGMPLMLEADAGNLGPLP